MNDFEAQRKLEEEAATQDQSDDRDLQAEFEAGERAVELAREAMRKLRSDR